MVKLLGPLFSKWETHIKLLDAGLTSTWPIFSHCSHLGNEFSEERFSLSCSFSPLLSVTDFQADQMDINTCTNKFYRRRARIMTKAAYRKYAAFRRSQDDKAKSRVWLGWTTAWLHLQEGSARCTENKAPLLSNEIPGCQKPAIPMPWGPYGHPSHQLPKASPLSGYPGAASNASPPCLSSHSLVPGCDQLLCTVNIISEHWIIRGTRSRI